MTRHLHLSIGPVQAFVKQSRRTRDLWASSYLLSFLTGHALCGAKTAGATVISPRTDNDPMLLRLENPANEAPLMGSLPNQFTLELPANTMPGAVAKAARQAFDAAWRHVCEAVWARFMEDAAALGNETRTIWDLQINGFWEFMWVAGSADETGLLARRKLWRTHWLSEEPGDKCSLMPDFQELSGYVRATQRQAQEDFWNRVRSRMPALDLDERERLCAIAMVKRLYPRVAEKALGWPVDVVHWPSTVDMAAAPWAGKVIASAARQADEFASAVERASDQRALSGGMRDLLDSTSTGKFARLDANWLHQSFLSNSKLAPLTTESDREGLVKRLEELYNAHGAPPIYFALLLADGDRLGQLAGSLGSEIVSQALAEFTRGAP
ncbi:MAG: type III-B CRISPR-associated protein Cas10/Cmr2, partial [Candidatus Binataceae bacterium]